MSIAWLTMFAYLLQVCLNIWQRLAYGLWVYLLLIHLCESLQTCFWLTYFVIKLINFLKMAVNVIAWGWFTIVSWLLWIRRTYQRKESVWRLHDQLSFSLFTIQRLFTIFLQEINLRALNINISFKIVLSNIIKMLFWFVFWTLNDLR